ncbi:MULTISPECIES: hypothetical protein [unclassified Vibrio]|uniref:hypothetical protein n=1 Tax=unclassified Vibrio TaxID=2614977 RepID=UPI0002FF9B7D|nr:hypothetical protein [Vibrio sp. 10N.261.54.E10]PMK10974.1 hypothetical protein BCU07_12045 [Vibrio sp. 10N.261.54.E10]
MLQEKHLIVGYSSHIFVNLYIDMLINKCAIHKKNLYFLTLDNNVIKNSIIESKYYKDFSLEEISSAKSITFISLNKNNSFLFNDICSFNETSIEKIYVHLTEDELTRWVKTKSKNGFLKVTPRNYMSDDCITVLKKIRNFIAAEKAFNQDLQYVLERSDFNITDARDAFSVMPTKELEKFQELYKLKSQAINPEEKILIGAKRGVFTLSETISILNDLDKKGALLDYKYMIFTYNKRRKYRILLDVYCAYLRFFKRKNIDISFPTVTNGVTYNALVMSCNHIILQDRGSMTTIKEYIRMERGIVHVRDKSRNYRELTETIGVQVESYQNFSELASNIVNSKINIKENSLLVVNFFNKSFERLRKVYS